MLESLRPASSLPAIGLFAFAIVFGPGCAVGAEEPPLEEGSEQEEDGTRTGEGAATCNTICSVGGGTRICLKSGAYPAAAVCGLATTYLCSQICQGRKNGIPKNVCRSPGAGRTCVLWDNLPWRTPRNCVGWTC